MTVPILQVTRMRLKEVWWEFESRCPWDIFRTQAHPGDQARTGGRQRHIHSAPHLGLTPAPACPGAADKSYQMEASVAVGSAVVKGCLGMGGGARWGTPRDSGLNFLPAMRHWRRETGGTWGWFLCGPLSRIGWGKGRRIEGIEKGERQRDREMGMGRCR